MNEEWRFIDGFNNWYQVSDTGNVRSVDRFVCGRMHVGKNIKQQESKKGYKRVTLSCCGASKTLSVHRLVGLAFIPNPNNEPQINHKNGNKADNCVANLEWCNNLQNIRHLWRVLGRKPPQKCGMPKKAVAMLDKDTNEVIKIFDCVRQASIAMCGSDKFRRNIAKTARGDCGRKTCLGYKWAFLTSTN